MGVIPDEKGEWKNSENNRALTAQCPQENDRLSMESTEDLDTEEMVIFLLSELSYRETSFSCVHREDYEWLGKEPVTMRTLLSWFIANW